MCVTRTLIATMVTILILNVFFMVSHNDFNYQYTSTFLKSLMCDSIRELVKTINFPICKSLLASPQNSVGKEFELLAITTHCYVSYSLKQSCPKWRQSRNIMLVKRSYQDLTEAVIALAPNFKVFYAWSLSL